MATPREVTPEMLEAAMKKAVETGLLPKHVDDETYLKNWAGIKAVLQAAVDLEIEWCKESGSTEFEKGRLAEHDRLLTELLDRGGFATLQLHQTPDHLPRMRFVQPSETQPVGAVRLSDGIILVRKPA